MPWSFLINAGPRRTVTNQDVDRPLAGGLDSWASWLHCSEPHPQNYHYCACVSARGAVYTVLYSLETQNLKMIPAARVFYPARPPALPVRPFSSGSTPLRSAPAFTYRFPQTYTHRLTAQLPLRSDGSTGREHRESSRTFARRGDLPDLPPFQSHPSKIVKSKRGKF